MVLVIFSYLSAKLWNALRDFIRTTEFTGFKMRIKGRILYSHFLINVTLNVIIYLVMYPYIICILAFNVVSRRYLPL